MKKFVSLLLAGVMSLGMAAAVSAETCVNDYGMIADKLTSNRYYDYYPWYGQNGNLLWEVEDGQFVPFNNYYYWYVKYLEDLKDAATDSDIFVSTETEIKGMFDADMVVEYGATACPTTDKDGKACANTSCKAYLIHTKTGYSIVVGCPAHGYQKVSDSTVVLPGVINPDVKNHTVYGYATLGGSVFLNGSTSATSVSVAPGSDVTVSIVPDYGYEVKAVYINNYNVGAVESYTLKNVRGNYTVSATFSKVNVKIPYSVKASTVGEGQVYAVVDGKSVGAISSLVGTYANTVSLRFVPTDSEHYEVTGVTINGVKMGKISSYNIGRLRTNLDVTATFAWKNPYTDVKTHLDAVEYVTVAGIMGTPNLHFDTDKFMGANGVSVKAMACYLAELADRNNKLSSVADRLDWAEAKGLIAEDEKLDVAADWQRACDMLEAFVRGLEKDNDITYRDLVNADSAYKVASAMDLVTELSYNANKNISRYDMAEICYAIAKLEIKAAK